MISRADIERLFSSQLAGIKDMDLREKVVEVWVKGCERGGWESVEELKKMPFTLVTQSHGVNFVEHTIAVTEGAVALAKAQMDNYRQMPFAINMDRLIVGGLLHDVGKLLEIEKDSSGGFRQSMSGKYLRHPISGAILAAEIGCSDDVVNTIACHAKEGEGAAQVVETILIHQADFATFNPLVMLNGGKLIQ